jgi:hypothetical protein
LPIRIGNGNGNGNGNETAALKILPMVRPGKAGLME